MIIWSGLGILVPVIAAICLFVMNAIVGSAAFDSQGWPKTIALLVAAGIVSVVGYKIRRQPGRVVVDKATGREVRLHRRHSVFFVPVLYWGPILAVIGIILLFTK
ncbi:MAG TPA: hypothetical protein VFA07_14035 [Chthonomonadaceae bacterium]|nr:hypothetical protein [Chthonomonadaceae bacterium]